MLGFCILAGALAAPPDRADTDSIISPADFRTWFDSAQRHKLTIPDHARRNAVRFRYVFITGLDIGFLQGCFVQNAKELRAQGVPASAIHFIDPSSQETIAENARSIRSQIVKIAAQGPEKLVLIGHSRGACAALAFALESPEFVARRVAALFLVQGPFGGTAVADFVVGEGSAIDRRMPPVARLAGQAIGRFKSSSVKQDKHAVIASMTRRASDDFWDEEIDANADAIPVVAPKTFYVTARTGPSRHPLLQRVTASYLGTYYGPNDGVIVLEDQSLPGLGTVLAVLDVGHTDLIYRFPSARPNQRLRRALIDAILMAVGNLAESGKRPTKGAPSRNSDVGP
jgi:pimeloyl-ACP methyl ester carboxylesterase